MYFFKKGGKQIVDLRGNLILSHNDSLVKSRVKSSAPGVVKNAKYILNISPNKFIYKIKASWYAIKFIWSKSQALTKEDIDGESI